MFVAPGTMPFGYNLTRQAAQDVARNWWVLLLNGALLVVAGCRAKGEPGALGCPSSGLLRS